MEVFMRNIPSRFDEVDIKVFLASILHGPAFGHIKTNFSVHLHKSKRPLAPVRTGTFTVADVVVGRKFLQLHGGDLRPAYLNGTTPIYFKESTQPPRQEILEYLARTPWVNLSRQQEQRRTDKTLANSPMAISQIQFCWSCRDGVYSIEAEVVQEGRIQFDPQRREMHVVVNEGFNDDIIAIKLSSIRSVSHYFSNDDEKYVVLLDLWHAPMFLRQNSFLSVLSTLDDLFLNKNDSIYSRSSTYPRVVNSRALPFVSLVLRLVFTSREEAEKFPDSARAAGIGRIYREVATAKRRKLFSPAKLNAVDEWLKFFDWPIAFQLASLLQNMALDASELLSLMPKVWELVGIKGTTYTVSLLSEFHRSVKTLWWDNSEGSESILSCFESTQRDLESRDKLVMPPPADGSYHQALHVTITPSSMFLEGPTLEQSNRVLRSFDTNHHQNFLRVSFREENHLQYRLDRAIKGRLFLQSWAGTYLKNGLTIAGHKFEFLAYSQSALKDHSVWFVKEFHDGDRVITARSIIDGLGVFDNLSYDPDLMRCPARYGARISQSFTSTDAAMVSVEKVIYIDDVKTPDGKYTFTDGVGTMSTDLAREIGRSRRGRNSNGSDFSRALQIRYEGSKGMLSVDHTIEHRRCICLRPSMIKFEAHRDIEHREVEIAGAFDSPTSYYLNRPLIMLMEGLGVPYETFRDFQLRAVSQAEEAMTTLKKAAKLLETHGLGGSFGLPSIMQNLSSKLGLESIYDDTFYHNLLKVAVHHVLRDLKYHARIPIPDAWTLVGVADVHRELEEGEVFIGIKYPGQSAFYLEGLVLISRSPTIHPGDVQVATAIGAPPRGSCFEKEPLYNTVVFSVQGARPLPSCLGGGDLDGDMYNIIPLKRYPEFTPKKQLRPAEYPPTQSFVLKNPSLATPSIESDKRREQLFNKLVPLASDSIC